MTFLENEAALLCVTMRKRSRAMTSTMSDMKFLSRRYTVENSFLWQELQVSLSRKRGPPPPPHFLYETQCRLHGLHSSEEKKGGFHVLEKLYTYI